MEFTKWVNGWGLGVTHPPLTEAQWTKNTTVRYIIQNTLDADKIRLYFTNRFGENAAELSHVTVAKYRGDKAIYPDTAVDVTFGGSKKAVMAPFGDCVSDEIPFNTSCGDKLAISIYFEGFTQLNTGFTYENKYFNRWFIEGDCTLDEKFDSLKMSYSASYNFLWSIDFHTYPDSYAVCAYGDSLTSQEWVDILSEHLIKIGNGKRAVVRRAVSGSRIFGSYPALSYFHYGEDGKARFEREVIHPGIEKVIVFHGINDIIHPDGKNPLRPMSNMPTVEKMAEGYKFYIDTASNAEIKPYLATLLPIFGWRTYDLARDDLRIAINGWIRHNPYCDVFDFEKAVCSKENQRKFDEGCDRGDHLHASVEGYRRIAACVPDSLFI